MPNAIKANAMAAMMSGMTIRTRYNPAFSTLPTSIVPANPAMPSPSRIVESVYTSTPVTASRKGLT